MTMRKTGALFKFKFKELIMNKTFRTNIIVVLGMTAIFKFLYAEMFADADAETKQFIFGLVLNIGVLYNMLIIGTTMAGTMLAKDKEKNTLRVLMTSSVNGAEYFIGSILPVFVITLINNIIVLLISGISLSITNTLLYLIVSAIGCLISCIIGMLVGLFAKNQMACSNLVQMVSMILLCIPLFANMMEGLEVVTKYLYTGVISNVVTSLAEKGTIGIDILSWLMLVVTAIVALGLFIGFYKKSGFERG